MLMQLNELFSLAKSVKQNHWRPRQVTVTTVLALATLGGATIDIESLQIDCLRFGMCLLLAPAFLGKASSFLFFFCCCGH